jgi:chorismate mutase
MNNNELKNLRDQIDQIDLKILNLINQRLETGKKIGKIKNQIGSHIIDDTREEDIKDCQN